MFFYLLFYMFLYFLCLIDVNKNITDQDRNWWSSYKCSSTPFIPEDNDLSVEMVLAKFYFFDILKDETI